MVINITGKMKSGKRVEKAEPWEAAMITLARWNGAWTSGGGEK